MAERSGISWLPAALPALPALPSLPALPALPSLPPALPALPSLSQLLEGRPSRPAAIGAASLVGVLAALACGSPPPAAGPAAQRGRRRPASVLKAGTGAGAALQRPPTVGRIGDDRAELAALSAGLGAGEDDEVVGGEGFATPPDSPRGSRVCSGSGSDSDDTFHTPRGTDDSDDSGSCSSSEGLGGAAPEWLWDPAGWGAKIAARPREAPTTVSSGRHDAYLDGHVASQCASGQLDHFLMYISRSTNVNIVVFQANLLPDGMDFDPTEPLEAYWHILVPSAEPPSQVLGLAFPCLDGASLREEITFFERQAFAVSCWREGEGPWQFTLAARPATTFSLEMVGSGAARHPRVCCEIDGEPCYVEKSQ